MVQAFVIAAAAAAFQLAFIKHNSFGLVILLFLLVSLAMMAFGFFIRCECNMQWLEEGSTNLF